MLRPGLAPFLTALLFQSLALDARAETPTGTASFPLTSEATAPAAPPAPPSEATAAATTVQVTTSPTPSTAVAPTSTAVVPTTTTAHPAPTFRSEPTPLATGWQLPPSMPYAPPPGGDRPRVRDDERSFSDRWMLSIEGATHAPLDIGVMAGFETPVGLRLSGGYGWVLPAYLGMTTGMIGSSAGADAQTTALIQNGFQGGHVWRIQGGIRPFPKLGLYLDAGYARANFSGSFDASSLGSIPGLSVSGGYAIDTTLDMWLVELGYQAHVGDHVVLALGVGVMGTFNARTTATPTGSGVPALDPAVTSNVDHQLEKHGYLPTLTARFGFDLL